MATLQAKKSNRVPQEMQKRYDEITQLIESFCTKHLNEEYAELARNLTAALCRKKLSPLVTGKPNTWAAAIVHALGLTNFLFDKKQTPHVSPNDIYDYFSISSSTGQAKSKQIRDLMRMSYFDRTWTLPSKMDKNPMVWLIQVDGILMDARSAPRNIQVMAFAKGLIPYIPAESQ
jgi:Domain of unknown function (DUF6398)